MFKNYLKIAFRNVWKNKVFATINLTGLALGICCSLGIFMVVNQESNFDTFHTNYKNIYRVVTDIHYPEGMEYQSGVAFPVPDAFRLDFPQASKVCNIYAAYNSQVDVLDEKKVTSEKRFKLETGVFYASPEFFDIFHFKWLEGNPASVLLAPNQVALSRTVAEKYFGSWQNAIGKSIRKDNNELLMVSGIIENPPVNTDFPLQVVISYKTLANSDAVRPRMQEWGSISSRNQCFILLPGDKEKTAILNGMSGFRKKHLEAGNTTDFFALQPLSDIHFNERYGNFALRTIGKKTLLSLSLVGFFLLALAGINFVNLSTAQAVKRSREVGIRKLLGSQRWQLAIQFMGETFLIVTGATVISLVALAFLSPVVEKILNRPMSMNPFRTNGTIAFVLAIVFGVTFLSGFYPAIIVSGFKPIQALKNRIAAATPSGISLRRILVVAQFIIAQGLIIATLVIISQIKFFRNAPLGFNKDAIVTITLPRDSISIAKWESFRQNLLQRPGVKNVSLSFSSPASRSSSITSFRYDQNMKDENFDINLKTADAEYFDTYHLQLVKGHFFDRSDTAREVVVNETLLQKKGVRNYADAIGKRIFVDGKNLQIAGVVKDFHQSSLHDPIQPVVIMPGKNNYRLASIKFQQQDVSGVLQYAEQLFAKTFPEYLFEYNFFDESIGKFYAQDEQLSSLFKLFAAVGVFISCIGLYGLILFMTIQRIREVGIRRVLGASVINILLLFFREFVWLVVIGFVIAAAVAWYYMNGWLNGFAYHTGISFWMIASVGFAAVLLAMVTVSIQTVQAALTNPVKSLKTE